MKENVEKALVDQINKLQESIKKARTSISETHHALLEDEKALEEVKSHLTSVRKKSVDITPGSIVTNVENGRQMVVVDVYPDTLKFDAQYPNDTEDNNLTFSYLDSTWRNSPDAIQMEVMINCICGNSTKIKSKPITGWRSEAVVTRDDKFNMLILSDSEIEIQCEKCNRELLI